MTAKNMGKTKVFSVVMFFPTYLKNYALEQKRPKIPFSKSIGRATILILCELCSSFGSIFNAR